MYWLRRCGILLSLLLLFCVTALYLPSALDPGKRDPHRRAEDRRWVNSSPYFLDRQACRWLGLCGLHHLRRDPAARPSQDDDEDELKFGELRRRVMEWEDENEPASRVDRKRNVKERRRVLRDVPDYVYRHAPLVHLNSNEQFWPSDIREHVKHMFVSVNGEELNATDGEWNLGNLQLLNGYEGLVVLKSNDDVETRPSWLHSHFNMPEGFNDHDDLGHAPPDGQPGWSATPDQPKEPTTWFDVDKDRPLHRITYPGGRRMPRPHHQPHIVPRGYKPTKDGYSKAPAILILVDKGSGVVDAFWFFFYSYNLGQTVLGLRFGNHVGDWEHCMVRFENGVPRGIFFSEHEGGQGYVWDAVQKSGDRPVIYSAIGSHAMYALPGDHPYVLPFRLLKDVTDEGPLWDPALNNYAYHYDYTVESVVSDVVIASESGETNPKSLVPAASNPRAPTSWFHFGGAWGDEPFSLADPRQWRLFGQYHYVNGPLGPKFKGLDRSQICKNEKCFLRHKLDPKAKWY